MNQNLAMKLNVTVNGNYFIESREKESCKLNKNKNKLLKLENGNILKVKRKHCKCKENFQKKKKYTKQRHKELK